MDCINCGNCKQNNTTYFCVKRNSFVIDDEVASTTTEKVRMGWKKGDPEYETHRRKSRSEKIEE